MTRRPRWSPTTRRILLVLALLAAFVLLAVLPLYGLFAVLRRRQLG